MVEYTVPLYKSCFSGESKDIERLELKTIAYPKKMPLEAGK